MTPLIRIIRQRSLFLTFLRSLLLSGNTNALGQEVPPGTLEIHPLTIIALRLTAREAESLPLDRLDYMAHDGGALLNQITALRVGNSFGGTIHFLTDPPHFSKKEEAFSFHSTWISFP